MAKEIEIGTASAVDIAKDLEHHRKTYRGFLRLLTVASVGVMAVLIVVFFLLS
ncbi:MAG: aa3-type cytochrome c oxidase subunit IV [Bauldia sp.]